MKTFYLIIAGDTHFNDYNLLKTKVDALLTQKTAFFEIIIISDAKNCAGMLGEQYATEKGYEVAEFINKGDTGRINVFKFNKKMVELADACICFWDGRSNPCRHLMTLVKPVGLSLTTVIY